jgi:hypothetical protein
MTTPAAVVSPEYRYTAAPWLAHYCTSAINRISDLYWERKLGISTTGNAPSAQGDAHRYGYVAYQTWFAVFAGLQLTARDVVVDIGAGKGRVICAAAMYDINEAVGVEIDPKLAEVAATNGLRMRCRRAPVRVLCQSASEFEFDSATVITMFHPFGGDTMRTMLLNLRDSLIRCPRRVRIAYVNPWHAPVVDSQPWLRLDERWDTTAWSRLKFPVHFYHTTAP